MNFTLILLVTVRASEPYVVAEAVRNGYGNKFFPIRSEKSAAIRAGKTVFRIAFCSVNDQSDTPADNGKYYNV